MKVESQRHGSKLSWIGKEDSHSWFKNSQWVNLLAGIMYSEQVVTQHEGNAFAMIHEIICFGYEIVDLGNERKLCSCVNLQ